MTRKESKSNESIYERCGMGTSANGEKYGVVEWVESNTLRWFGHIEKMKNKNFMEV